jgi:hypothetical protein
MKLHGRTEKTHESRVSIVKHLVYIQIEYLQNVRKVIIV